MNPFKYGSTVAADNFCPRPALAETISRHIISSQNIHVEGERRTGKTSLVFEVCAKLPKRLLLHTDFMLVKNIDDMRGRLIDGLSRISVQAGVFERLLKALAHLRPAVSINTATGEPTLSVTTRAGAAQPDGRNLVELLEFVRVNFAARSPVIFFDEFQDVLKVKDAGALLAVLRSCIQNQHDCTYIYSGSSRSDMDAIFRDPSSPFYKSAIPVPVAALPRPEFVPFLQHKFRQGGRRISTELLNSVLDMVFDNPGDTQELCNSLWETTAEGTILDDTHLNQALQLIFAREFKYFEQVINSSTTIQKKCLHGLAALDGDGIYSQRFTELTGISNTGTITKAVRRLVDNRIIYCRGTKFMFASPFLKLWLLANPNF